MRLRLVNGSNARIYDLRFEDRRAFHWIGTEGGLLERPVKLRSIRLAPGQRAELLVDFSDGRSAGLLTAADPNMAAMSMMRTGGSDAVAGQVFLRFEPVPGPAGPVRIPEILARRPAMDLAAVTRRRKLVLTMTMGGTAGGGMGGGGMGGGRSGGAASFGIDRRAFDMRRIDQQIGLGETEIWEVSGQMMAHPFHVHGVHFQVLSRNGGPPGVLDQGPRDTVLVQEPTELLVQFTKPTAGAPFMYHCHIFEHEDQGMMGQFSVT